MKPYRVLVTGSRDWEDIGRVWRELNDIRLRIGPRPLVVVHGDCPTGADYHAKQFVEWHIFTTNTSNITQERHPADWKRHGRAAGVLRNIEMVESGVDECLAFIRNNSRGATHCSVYAMSCGVTTKQIASQG